MLIGRGDGNALNVHGKIPNMTNYEKIRERLGKNS